MFDQEISATFEAVYWQSFYADVLSTLNTVLFARQSICF